jgi:hypothetical protein
MRILTFSTLAFALSTAACGSSVNAGSGGGGATSSAAGGAGGAGGATSSSSSSSGTGGGPTCTPPADPQTFELGTGQTCFERLTPGQTVPVMQGPQGGFHLWLAIGCADCGLQAILQYGVKDPATHDWYAGTGFNQAVAPISTTGWFQLAGLTDFLPGQFWNPTSFLPKGTHVLMSAAVLDASMNVKHEAEVEVVLGDTMEWSPPCDSSSTCGAPGGLPCCSDGFADGGLPSFGDAGVGGAGGAGP